jgi:hypothetical protein
VERLRDSWQAVRARRDRQQGLIEEVAALRPVPPPRGEEDPHRPTPVDAWLELADFVDDRLTVLHSRLRELEEELKGVEHELDVAADRLSRASTDAPAAHVETTLCAVVTLTGVSGTDVEVEVEYGCPAPCGYRSIASGTARARVTDGCRCVRRSPSAPARTGTASASRWPRPICDAAPTRPGCARFASDAANPNPRLRVGVSLRLG